MKLQNDKILQFRLSSLECCKCIYPNLGKKQNSKLNERLNCLSLLQVYQQRHLRRPGDHLGSLMSSRSF
jgi:hypothetical protein